jgi:ABC-2 type transport system ATP-binding protein
VLEEYGTVAHYAPPRATLEVPREIATAASTRLLGDLDVADLSIQDPPIEEVIRIAFGESELEASEIPIEAPGEDASEELGSLVRTDVRRAPP